jgi:uncharacterized protein (DUF1778 family)
MRKKSGDAYMRAARVKEYESANDRITAKVPHATRSIIERAAEIYGATINQFIVQAAVKILELQLFLSMDSLSFDLKASVRETIFSVSSALKKTKSGG